MNSVLLQVLLLALVAGASPVALGATLVVLGKERGRRNGAAFALGVVLGQAVTVLLAFVWGSALVPAGSHAHQTVRAVLALALGVALVAFGVRERLRPPGSTPPGDSRTKRVLDRLARLRASELFGAGFALTLGPKRLALTVLVAGTIVAGDFGTVTGAVLTVGYVVLATAFVTVPVVLTVVFGHRADEWMVAVKAWLDAHKRSLTVYPLIVLGVLIAADALIALTS